MNAKRLTFLMVSFVCVRLAVAQSGTETNDWKPATTNQRGAQYPQVNSEGRVRARISAPQAQSVQLEVNGVRYPMTKDANGVWTGDSAPLDQGNHYYGLVIDGAQVPDPNSTFIYGSGAWRNDIEIPAFDEEFYTLKNVPHGQLREVQYFSKTSGSIRHSFVYTPPGYETNPRKNYPVLYLQHGYNEAESGWGAQGHAGLIMDNLIAEGKATPFIIVMENGGISGGASGMRGAGGGFNFSTFEHALIDDVIPYVDANFRTLADQSHRAMAGLSMGGMQTRQIALAHLDTFAYIGIFSGGTIRTNDIAKISEFKKKVKLVFLSYGSREIEGANRGGGARGPMFGGNPQADVEALKSLGVNARFYVSPNTAHEWQSWRRSLHEFAPLLFTK